MTEPYTPEKAEEVGDTLLANPRRHWTFFSDGVRRLGMTLRAYASLLTREAKMREALEEIAGRGGDCGRIALRALEETR
jgi:hypothetical protein